MRTTSNDAIDERLRAAWATIEARRKFPAVIAIASATPEDDTATVASALMRLGAQAGRRTAGLALDRTGSAEGTWLPLPGSIPALEIALQEWRERFDVVVLSLRATLEEALYAHALGIADGIVIAICGGRRVTRADRDLAILLAQVPGHVFGAVMTARAQVPETPVVPAGSPEPATVRPTVESLSGETRYC
jgi:hypothetical protein